MMDRWDILGGVGAGLVGGGLWALAGWPWAWIWWGALLLGLYAIRELRSGGAE